MKRLVSCLILVSILCGVLCACQPKEEIPVEEAGRIMLKDLGEDAVKVTNPHVHIGTYARKDCYNIFFTLDNEPYVYVISFEGEILYKGVAEHSH